METKQFSYSKKPEFDMGRRNLITVLELPSKTGARQLRIGDDWSYSKQLKWCKNNWQ